MPALIKLLTLQSTLNVPVPAIHPTAIGAQLPPRAVPLLLREMLDDQAWLPHLQTAVA